MYHFINMLYTFYGESIFVRVLCIFFKLNIIWLIRNKLQYIDSTVKKLTQLTSISSLIDNQCFAFYCKFSIIHIVIHNLFPVNSLWRKLFNKPQSCNYVSEGEPIKLPDNLESLPRTEHFPIQRHRWNTNEVSHFIKFMTNAMHRLDSKDAYKKFAQYYSLNKKSIYFNYQLLLL